MLVLIAGGRRRRGKRSGAICSGKECSHGLHSLIEGLFVVARHLLHESSFSGLSNYTTLIKSNIYGIYMLTLVV